MKNNVNLGESMLMELRNISSSKEIVVSLIDHALYEINVHGIAFSDDIVDGLFKLKRKYKLLYPEYIPSKESFKYNQVNQDAILNALEELTSNSSILEATKTIEAIEANFEKERIVLGLEKKSIRNRLKIAFNNYTTRP